MHKNSNEKLDAIKFELNNLKNISSLGKESASGHDAKQAFAHVCAEMNGPGDWLITEQRCTKTAWDALVKNNVHLFIICKIDTRNKHAATSAKKWQTKANQIDHHNEFTLDFPSGLSGKGATVTPHHTIEVDGKSYDSFELANDALTEIETFIKQLQPINP